MGNITTDYITIDESIYQLDKEWRMTNDLLFKYLFGRDTAESKIMLIDLVNTVLRLEGGERIVEIKYNNPFNLQKYISDKSSVTDIKVTTGEAVKYNIEMQVIKQNDYMQRSLLYWGELYSENIGAGEEYNTLKRTVGIHFLDHQLFDDKEYPHQVCTLKNQDDEIVTDLIEIHYIQIPLMGAIIKTEQELLDWLVLMKDISNPKKQKEVEMVVNSKEVMKVAYTEFKKATADKELRQKMSDELKARRDRNSQLRTSHEDGKAEGREEGREEGLVEGRAEIIKTMLKNNIPIEQIEVMTNISREEIKKYR